MQLKFFSIIIFTFLITSNGFAQGETNQYDDEGERHGVWQQYYPGTEQLRYTGTFNHGRETGLFQFYCEDCKDQPAVTKQFNGQDLLAEVKYFNKEGKLMSVGMMDGKKRVGTWKYFDEETEQLLLQEEYEDGELHGEKITYYDNGVVTEKSNYNKGILHGKSVFWDANGTLIKVMNYENGKLNGKSVFYDSRGDKMIEGHYKDDKEVGNWKYYTAGTLVQEENKSEE